MLSVMISALRASVVMFVLCGLLYPLTLTGVGQLILPFQANGSLERSADGVIIGSRLIGQQWNGPEWFHGRPSATTGEDPSDPNKTVSAPYNAANSGGSNLGPTSKSLMDRLWADRSSLETAEPDLTGKRLPADMLTTSASGLDPDISPANALLQAGRVARTRGIPVAKVNELVRQHVTGRSLRLFGEPRVNVLALNLALQRAAAPSHEARSELRK
jgi:potassium-transporting ATPase KdpC subunit